VKVEQHTTAKPPDVQLSTDELPKLIDCEEDRALRAVLVGMLREADPRRH
jgi:hypothetical protein